MTTPFQVAVIKNLEKTPDTNLDIPKAYHGTLAATPMLKEEFLQLC